MNFQSLTYNFKSGKTNYARWIAIILLGIGAGLFTISSAAASQPAKEDHIELTKGKQLPGDHFDLQSFFLKFSFQAKGPDQFISYGLALTHSRQLKVTLDVLKHHAPPDLWLRWFSMLKSRSLPPLG